MTYVKHMGKIITSGCANDGHTNVWRAKRLWHVQPTPCLRRPHLSVAPACQHPIPPRPCYPASNTNAFSLEHFLSWLTSAWSRTFLVYSSPSTSSATPLCHSYHGRGLSKTRPGAPTANREIFSHFGLRLRKLPLSCHLH